MSLFETLNGRSTGNNGISGVAVAVVTNNQDPDGEGRIKVKYPWRDSEDESYWARVLTFMGGNEIGGYFLPEVGDEVLVAFENGDIDYPFIIGSLWSGKMKPPETNDDGKNNRRLIKSRSEHQVILDDTEGSEKIEIKDKSNNTIIINTADNAITISSEKDITIKAANGKVAIQAKDIEIKADMGVKIESGSNMDIKAGANMTQKGQMISIN